MADSTADPTIPSTDVAAAPSPAPPASDSEPALTRTVSFSKLNAKAPEFVPSPRGDPRLVITPPPPPSPAIIPAGMVHVYGAPRTPLPLPVQGPMPVQNLHFQQIHHHQKQHQQYQHHQQQHHHRNHHHNQFHGGGEQEGVQSQQVQNDWDNGNSAAGLRNGLTEEASQKIINQVEYYFSDVNLATTDHLIKFINKDHEGYVPIAVVASFKKIKALISTNSQLAAVLRNSKKLVVSDDGKKVKRLHSLTASDMEELQARIIVAENLPEDHCHQNLMKIFSSVGSVKSIRTCQPQASNIGGSATSRSSKPENMLYSNKLHAFVEYDTIELAEKAVAELNDDDWRSGLRVRLLLKRTSKSVQARGRKFGNEGEETCEEDGSELNQSEKQAEDTTSRQSDIHSIENMGEEQGGEKEGGQKKGRNRGRGKGRGRGHQHQANRAGAHVGTLTNNPAIIEPASSSIVKQHHPPGPRMPDGTRGFSMGRGKPVTC